MAYTLFANIDPPEKAIEMVHRQNFFLNVKMKIAKQKQEFEI